MTADSKTPEMSAAGNMQSRTESLLQFPTNFPIKTIGFADPSLPGIVADIARRHCDDFDDSTLTMRHSRTRKYLAVTIEIVARSREQLDAIYLELTKHPLVISVY